MQLMVLNLNDLTKTFEAIDDIDITSREGERCVPSVLRWQMANSRLGSAKTKLMSEVSGSTKKIVRQKGSGGARHGGKRAVQFVGGRTCFGPQPRDFSFSLPKKIVRKALRFTIVDKIRQEKLLLLEGMDRMEISTKSLAGKFRDLQIEKALVACDMDNYREFGLSLRNLYNYKSLPLGSLNVYDILSYDYLMVDRKLLDELKEVIR